jgi:hypothetical protein
VLWHCAELQDALSAGGEILTRGRRSATAASGSSPNKRRRDRIARRLAEVSARIARARRPRSPDGASDRRQKLERSLGRVRGRLHRFGENRVRRASAAAALPADVEWHLLGPLQTNRARRSRTFAVSAVDRERLAAAPTPKRGRAISVSGR